MGDSLSGVSFLHLGGLSEVLLHEKGFDGRGGSFGELVFKFCVVGVCLEVFGDFCVLFFVGCGSCFAAEFVLRIDAVYVEVEFWLIEELSFVIC